MKIVNLFFIAIVIMLCSCESEPKVSMECTVSEYEDLVEHNSSEISFKGKNPEKYVVFDKNKVCSTNGSYAFRTFKTYQGATINKGDLCAKCGYSWSSHDDK